MTHVLRAVLRAVVIVIAVAAAIDPVLAVNGAIRARIALIVQDPASSDADRVRTQLTTALAGAFEILPGLTSDSAAAIVVGTSGPRVAAGFGRTLVSTVTLPQPPVVIAGVTAPVEVPAATAIHVEADVDGGSATGQSTDLVARIAGIEIGRASHRWTAARERWRATLDVAPFGEPPFVIRLDAGSSAADVVVSRRSDPIRVLVRDARPSWASTFARRALEADPRFHVDSIVSSSRGIAARTGDAGAPSDPNLDTFDAIVVGGLDALTAVDVRALNRYMRERGGAVVLVPDQRVTQGPAADLMPAATERLLERPATLTMRAAAPLQASELFLPNSIDANVDVIATTPGADAAPVVVSMPRGAGRLLLSGAMDAWRFRAANERAFDRFWQATVAGLALATPPLVDIRVSPPILRPGERAEVVVRARGVDAAAGVSASVDDRPLRLWPDAEPGVYRGAFVADVRPRGSPVRAAVSGRAESAASRLILVRDDVRRASTGVVAPLAMLAAAHGGIDVTPDRVADLVRFVRDRVRAPRAARPAHPMRSPWWIVPFAGCLAGEWWLRRRRGLR